MNEALITQEALKRFGFKSRQVPNQQIWELDGFVVWNDHTGQIFKIMDIEIKYVIQLQTVFYTLKHRNLL